MKIRIYGLHFQHIFYNYLKNNDNGMYMDSISILMPIYNGIEYFDDSLSSIINQTYKNYELIIGVNGNNKNSDVYLEVLDKVNKHKYTDNISIHDLYEIKGKSNALNEMVNMCKYEWVSLLDVDDIWHKDKLINQKEYIGKYDVIGTNCKYFGDSDIIPELPMGDVSDFNFFKYNPIVNSSCIIRKSLAKWDGNDGVEDYELWLQLIIKNKKFFNVNKILTFHRIHTDSCYNSKGNHLLVEKLKEKYVQEYYSSIL